MTTTTAQEITPATAEADAIDVQAAADPVLGEIVVSRHDSTAVYRWTLGTNSWANALTVTGLERALRATADYLDGMSGGDRTALKRVAGAPHFRLTPGLWELPVVPGHGDQVAAMMTEVVNAPGSIGLF